MHGRNKLNIGINLLAILPGISGGIEFYVQNLLVALAGQDNTDQFTLFTNLDNYHKFEIKKDNFHRVKIGIHSRPQILRIAFEQCLLPMICKKLRLNVLHSPSYTFPIMSQVPGVVTICDMLYKEYPKAISLWKFALWKLLIPLSVRRCKKVLTISENSKKEIIKYLQIPCEKVIVTPLALDMQLKGSKPISDNEISLVCDKYGIRRPYILNVGGIGLHKNPKVLIKALHLLHHREGRDNLSLVIAGHDYGFKRVVESEILRLGLAKVVFLPGYVSTRDLPALYSGAEVYVSPSFLEGFGLTLLEAMNFGTPVVISDRHSLPEVAGDAALIVDPNSPNELANAILQILWDSSVRDNLIKRGFDRLKEFSWDEAAALTLAAYRETANS